jgi:prevent-host-death family protein
LLRREMIEMAQFIREQYVVNQKGKPTAVILDIEKYRKMLLLVQERLDRKESQLLSESKDFKKLVRKGLKEIKEGKINLWKDVWDEL